LIECEDLNQADKEAILHGSAETFYGLKTPAVAGAR